MSITINSPEKYLNKQISGLHLIFRSNRVWCYCGARHNAEMDLCGTDYRCASRLKIVCFPELSVTGYTCGDLFLQDALPIAAKTEIVRIIKETAQLDIVSIVGISLTVCGKLYNCAVVINKGKAIGTVAKKNIPNYNEFYEARHFTPAEDNLCVNIKLDNEYSVHLEDTLFTCTELPDLIFGIEICEDMWVSSQPSEQLAQRGTVIIFNISISDEVTVIRLHRLMVRTQGF